jgi:hypothetical protein
LAALKPTSAKSADQNALEELVNLFSDPDTEITNKPVKPGQTGPLSSGPPGKRPKSSNSDATRRKKPTTDPNEAEFWDLVDDD